MKVRLKISIVLILLTLLSTIVVFSIFLIVNLFSRNENISISTYSEENNTIKVLSYNINHGNGLSSEEQKKKLNSIAQYIKDNKIEIGGLQEVSTFQDPDIAIQLENELKAVGYPMNFVVPETLEEDYFKNIIISKYPIVDSEFIQKGSRWVVISQIQSPIGLIRFSSVHVHHGKGNCSAIKSTVNIMKKYQSDPMMIMVGDYNIGLFEPTCETKIGDHYDFSCEKGQPCESFDMIDWVFLTKNGNVLKQIYRSKDKNMKASDHLPVIALIKTNQQIPTPTPPPTPTPVVIGKAVCLGFNIYDNSDDFPTIIVNSQTISPKRKLSETLTIRSAVKNPTETKSNEICWSSSGLEKAEYYQKSNWSCTTVCGNDPISGIGNGVCDDQTIMKGHVTNTIQGYIEKIPEITIREKAKTKGLVFVTNIFDKTGGFCTTSPGYTETGTYFTKMTGGVDGQPLANGDVNLKCGVAADGNNCVRRVEIVEAGISEITKEDIDFSKDGKVGIDDFMKFVEYYKAGDCKVDLNKNSKCREIADFQEFIKGYKSFYVN